MKTALPVIVVAAFAGTLACAQQTAPQAPVVAHDKAPSAAEPDVSKMKLAKAVAGKGTVPVDVRYAFTNKAAKNRSASLQLAFVPRVEGSALRVEFPKNDSVSVSETEELMVQKAAPASVHRHNLVVTPLKADTGEIRALVSMDVEGGRYFGIFVIPVGPSEN